MRRIASPARADWRERCETIGFFHHSHDESHPAPYWNEKAFYEFTLAEIERIEEASNQLHSMCLEAAARIVADEALMARVGVPAKLFDLVRTSWANADPTLYGRFDLATDGHDVKLLEYNADTPTSLVEASLAQWQWLEDVRPDAAREKRQFNSIHENLIDRFRQLAVPIGKELLYFTCYETNLEDFATTEYLRDLATQAGIRTEFMPLANVALTDFDFRTPGFQDSLGRRIRYIFKLYPWEWLAQDDEAGRLPVACRKMGVLEPPWKMLLSTKGLLPVLWSMYPGHDLLLPAHFDQAAFEAECGSDTPWVSKPMHGREGESIHVRDGGTLFQTPGPYGKQARIFQKLVSMPLHDDRHAVVGAWIVDGAACGIGVRESVDRIVKQGSQFVPHLFI